MSTINHKSTVMPVRQALWNLQKELLNTLKQDFDQQNGYEAAPVEWFQILTTADRYTWLREMTSLMADIDILTELESISDQQAAVARLEVERLLFNQDAAKSAFAENYSNLLISGMTLLPLHSHLRAALQTLPKHDINEQDSTAHRKGWQEEHRSQARKKRN